MYTDNQIAQELNGETPVNPIEISFDMLIELLENNQSH